MTDTFTLEFTKDNGRDVTYIHDEAGMRFVVERSDEYTDVIECDSADGMNFFMNLLAADGYEGLAII